MRNEEFTQAILGMTDTLYRVAATQLRQRADREDAVQECLRKAWEKRHRLRRIHLYFDKSADRSLMKVRVHPAALRRLPDVFVCKTVAIRRKIQYTKM